VARPDGWWLESGYRMPGYGTDTRTSLAERLLMTLTKPQLWCIARAVFAEGRHSLAPVLTGARPNAVQISTIRGLRTHHFEIAGWPPVE
jgi:hypothetical protein